MFKYDNIEKPAITKELKWINEKQEEVDH